MLSRNQIRIKILHCIYSSYIKNDFQNVEFKNSFDGYKNLYSKILEILLYVKNRAEFEIKHGLKKNIATQEDLNPNEKFIKNKMSRFHLLCLVLQKKFDHVLRHFFDIRFNATGGRAQIRCPRCLCPSAF